MKTTPMVDVTQLSGLLPDPGMVVVHVRPTTLLARGHIPSAVTVPGSRLGGTGGWIIRGRSCSEKGSVIGEPDGVMAVGADDLPAPLDDPATARMETLVASI